MNKLQNNFNSQIFNSISIVLLIYFMYKFSIFMNFNSISKLIGFLIPFTISSLIITLLLNDFKYSKNKIVKHLQKLAISSLILTLILLIFNYFNLQLFSSFYCDSYDESIENISTSTLQEEESTPSLTDFNINSPLEDLENLAPLEIILNNLFALNLLEFILLLTLIFLILHKYVYKLNINIFINFINKFISKKYKKHIITYSEKSIKINNRFITIMIIIIIILLLLFKLGIIYVSYELSQNIDNYIVVYNYLKKIK